MAAEGPKRPSPIHTGFERQRTASRAPQNQKWPDKIFLPSQRITQSGARVVTNGTIEEMHRGNPCWQLQLPRNGSAHWNMAFLANPQSVFGRVRERYKNIHTCRKPQPAARRIGRS